jgi:UDP-N-acetylglucosamine 1-carboxyvinyltransferase
VISQEGILVDGLNLKDMEQGLKILQKLNVQIEAKGENGLLVKAPPRTATIPENMAVIAGLAREFHSDWAPLLEVVLTTMRGHCRIVDTLFSDRVRQAELLKDMGADIQISGGLPPQGIEVHFSADPQQARYIIDVTGPAQLKAIATSVGYDVRACAAMVMAASQANGTSKLSDVQSLYRGYENIIERLNAIGVDIAVI